MSDARRVLRHRAVQQYLVSTALAAIGLNVFVTVLFKQVFDVTGDDGETIDNWTDVLARAPSFASGTVWGSVTGGRATGGFARWPEHQSGSQDSQHPNHSSHATPTTPNNIATTAHHIPIAFRWHGYSIDMHTNSQCESMLFAPYRE